jgi:ribosome-associated protein
MTKIKPIEAAKIAYKALDDKMAVDIKVLDISKVSTVADFFIVASGNNPSQLSAMAEETEQQLFKAGVKLNHSEGMQSKSWILLDFGDIVVHLFGKEERSFYNIERVWGDAKEVDEAVLKD